MKISCPGIFYDYEFILKITYIEFTSNNYVYYYK